MATKLLKNILRESTETIGDKEIHIILTEGQEIELKLKGKRGSGRTIYIKDLYNQLYNIDPKDSNLNDGPVKIIISKPKRGDNKMISLHDLRSHNAISVLELGIKAKLDQIIKSVLDSYK